MPTATCHHHLLSFFLFIFVLHLGAPMKPATSSDPNGEVHDLLPAFGLPKGLLPDNVVSYAVSGDGQFTVELSAEPCYAQFSELVSFDKTIKGKIAYGVVSDLSGIKVKKLVFWFPIVRVDAGDGHGTILFDTGSISEKHPASEFQDVRRCKSSAAAAADA